MTKNSKLAATVRAVEKLMTSQASIFDTKLAAQERQGAQWQTLTDKALVLQAEENQRRLQELNGERAHSREERGTFMRQDSFEVFMREQSIRRDEDAHWKSAIANQITAVQTRAATWTIAVGLFSTVLTGIVTAGIAALSLYLKAIGK